MKSYSIFYKGKPIKTAFVTKDKLGNIVNQQLLFVVNEDGSKEMYLYPQYKQIYGKSIHPPKVLKNMKYEEYDLRKHNKDINLARYSRDYYDTYNNLNDQYGGQGLNLGGLSNLYFDSNDEYGLEHLEINKRQLMEIAKKRKIKYETNPEVIIKNVISTLESNRVYDEYMSNPDISFCTSVESVKKYINEKIKECCNIKQLMKLSDSLNGMVEGASYYIIENYTAPLMSDSYLLNMAISDDKFDNKDNIIKSYLEYCIVFPYLCKILKELENGSKRIEKMKNEATLNDFYSNEDFVMEVNSITQLREKQPMFYHATANEVTAGKILQEGLYCFSDDIFSTAQMNLNTNQLLTYEYGNGAVFYGDYVVVLSSNNEEEIIRKLTPEEKENVIISPRRMALTGKPDYVIDPKYIIGYLDKKKMKFVYNKKYQLGNEDAKRVS